jgi:hypothetical protein
MLLVRSIAAISSVNAFVYALILALSTIEYAWRDDPNIVTTSKQFSRARTLIHFSFMSSAFGFCAALVCMFCSCFNLHRAHRRIVTLLCLTLSFVALTTGILSSGFGVSVLAHKDYQLFDELMIISLLDMVAVFLQSLSIILLFNRELQLHKETVDMDRISTRQVY